METISSTVAAIARSNTVIGGSSGISGVVGWIITKYGGIPRNIETDIVNIPITYKPTGYFKPHSH